MIVFFLCVEHFFPMTTNKKISATTIGSSIYPASLSQSSNSFIPKMSTDMMMMMTTVSDQNPASTQHITILALVDVGARVLFSLSEDLFRSREESPSRVKLWARVIMNMHGTMKRDSLPMFIKETAATALVRMTDVHRYWSIWRASLEKGWFSMTVIFVCFLR